MSYITSNIIFIFKSYRLSYRINKHIYNKLCTKSVYRRIALHYGVQYYFDCYSVKQFWKYKRRFSKLHVYTLSNIYVENLPCKLLDFQLKSIKSLDSCFGLIFYTDIQLQTHFINNKLYYNSYFVKAFIYKNCHFIRGRSWVEQDHFQFLKTIFFLCKHYPTAWFIFIAVYFWFLFFCTVFCFFILW
jgi:hypothetical protein